MRKGGGGFSPRRPGQAWTVEKHAERVAENEVIFRRANEEIEEVAEKLDESLTIRLIPFLCECADRRCTQIIRLSLREYEDVRASPRRFAIVSGHEMTLENEQVIARSDRFTIVEKVGEGGRVAAESDPRQ
jgi:hypothetical protein